MNHIFNKKMPKYCKNCLHSRKLNEKSLLCPKRGAVAPDDSCRAYRYDPLKRVPAPPAALEQYKSEDFEL